MKCKYFRALFLYLMPAVLLTLGATAITEAQDREVSVSRVSKSGEVVPSGTGSTAEGEARIEPSGVTVLTRPPAPAPDLEVCRLPAVRVEILDPATGRAVVRQGSNPPRVVKPGSVLADTAAVVRQVGADKLVADVEIGDGGLPPVLWIFAAEASGEPSRMQCFVPASSPQPSPTSQ